MWAPRQVRKLIAQLAGIALGIAGLAMILEELQTTGLIRLGPILASGTLSQGAVGLFLVCLSLLLIALPVLWGAEPIRGLPDPRAPSKLVGSLRLIGRLALLTGCAIALSVTLLFGGDLLAAQYGSKIGTGLQLLGVVVGVLSGAMIVFLGFLWVDAAGRGRSSGGESSSADKSDRLPDER